MQRVGRLRLLGGSAGRSGVFGGRLGGSAIELSIFMWPMWHRCVSVHSMCLGTMYAVMREWTCILVHVWKDTHVYCKVHECTQILSRVLIDVLACTCMCGGYVCGHVCVCTCVREKAREREFGDCVRPTGGSGRLVCVHRISLCCSLLAVSFLCSQSICVFFACICVCGSVQ